jgi:hypothetical protein
MVGRTRGAPAAPDKTAAAVDAALETAMPEANVEIVPRQMAATVDLLDFDSFLLFMLPEIIVKRPTLGAEYVLVIIFNRGTPPSDDSARESVFVVRSSLLPGLKAALS